jgi:integrase/recombinase XerD
VLFDLGMKLMAEWQSRKGHDPRLNAMDYRDGLMIAFLALCPIRVANLAAMRIGRHLLFDSGAPRVRFEAAEMKGRRALEFNFPATLLERLEFYLERVHPKLFAGPLDAPPLWPSLARRQPQMTPHGIYKRLTSVTQKHLSTVLSPHLFRDAAATFIAELAPEHARMAAAVLQHRSFGTTTRHYVHGQQHLAARKYQLAVADIVASHNNDGASKGS